MNKRYLRKYWFIGCLVCLVTAGCTSIDSSASPVASQQPTPSVAPVFGVPPTRIPSPRPLVSQDTISPAPATTSTPAATVAPSTQVHQSHDRITRIAIFDETLNPNWSLANSQGIRNNLSNKTFIYTGSVSLSARPDKAFSKLFFTVRKESREIYRRDRVLGVSFWLSGGSSRIGTSDLAITVVGSNQYPYWTADDTSVAIDAPVTPTSPLFSETRLYFLGINRSIPPGDWAEVVVWLDDLINDPDYTYVTGIYIKNDETFLDTFYLDHMDLLVQPNP